MCNNRTTSTLNIPIENITYNFCFFFIHGNCFRVFVIIISKTTLKTNQLSPFHFHFQTFFYISRYIFNFLLCHGTKYHQKQFSVHS